MALELFLPEQQLCVEHPDGFVAIRMPHTEHFKRYQHDEKFNFPFSHSSIPLNFPNCILRASIFGHSLVHMCVCVFFIWLNALNVSRVYVYINVL